MIVTTVPGSLLANSDAGPLAIMTLCAALVLGLATMARPSPATISWGVGISLALLGTYLWIASDALAMHFVRGLGAGLMMTFMPILWHGLRFYFDRPRRGWAVMAYVVAGPLLLTLTSGTDVYLLTFRAVFALSGVFAALVAWELLRSDRRIRDLVLPLALAAATYVLVALAVIVAMFWAIGPVSVEQLEALHDLNQIGAPLIGICAAITLVILVRGKHQAEWRAEGATDRARWRLSKARVSREADWAVLDLRLDDLDELREAWTGAVFSRIVTAFHEAVAEAIPSTADVERVADDRAIVIVRAEQDAITEVLKRIPSRTAERAAAGVWISISTGWAPAVAGGYDYDYLAELAAAAAVVAQRKGGDCWERVSPVA